LNNTEFELHGVGHVHDANELRLAINVQPWRKGHLDFYSRATCDDFDRNCCVFLPLADDNHRK
jgi:hypothetical protein